MNIRRTENAVSTRLDLRVPVIGRDTPTPSQTRTVLDLRSTAPARNRPATVSIQQ